MIAWIYICRFGSARLSDCLLHLANTTCDGALFTKKYINIKNKYSKYQKQICLTAKITIIAWIYICSFSSARLSDCLLCLTNTTCAGAVFTKQIHKY